MITEPLVSVIITTYNRVKLLEHTLNSVLNQTHTNLEIIIVSDASFDGTDKYIESISDSRLKYFKLSNNSGLPSVTRNVGLKYATGEYIAFCDDDDIWKINKIEKQLIKIENHDLCFSKRSFINEYGLPIKHRPIFFPRQLTLSTLLITNYIVLSSVVIKKSIINQFVGFNELPEFKASEDYELWTRLLANNISITLCPEELVLYRIHTNNISNNMVAGIERTMLINNKLFENYKVSIILIIFSTFINNFKKLYYKLLKFIK
jgi:teichuronic acid biosynthesis glycosyltransferase TuaG